MNINIITLFPEMFDALQAGIVGRAIDQKLLQINTFNPRDAALDERQTVDDHSYGGGPGMVMSYQPLADTLLKINTKASTSNVIYLSPQGKPVTQGTLKKAAQADNLTLISGRYEGIDQRIIDTYVDEEWSIGDFVVSGGELPAMLVIDGITRLLPGALGHPDSAVQDSFQDGLLDHPHYTRPQEIAGQAVPEVLLSGDHALIKRYRLKQALGNTWQKRPDLLKRRVLTSNEQQLLSEYIEETPQDAEIKETTHE